MGSTISGRGRCNKFSIVLGPFRAARGRRLGSDSSSASNSSSLSRRSCRIGLLRESRPQQHTVMAAATHERPPWSRPEDRLKTISYRDAVHVVPAEVADAFYKPFRGQTFGASLSKLLSLFEERYLRSTRRRPGAPSRISAGCAPNLCS